MNSIESEILADLHNDKRKYQELADRLACDEDGCTIDVGLLNFYQLTLSQIEADIARYTKYEVVMTTNDGKQIRLAVKDRTTWSKSVAQAHARDMRCAGLKDRYIKVEVKEA